MKKMQDISAGKIDDEYEDDEEAEEEFNFDEWWKGDL